MKKGRRMQLLPLCIALLCVFFLMSCDQSTPEAEIVEISGPETINVTNGYYFELVLSSESLQNATWVSSNPAVVKAYSTQSSTVSCQAVGTGSATITAYVDELSDSVTVNVVPLPPTSIYISYGDSIDLGLGTSYKLSVSLSPYDAAPELLSWVSDAPDVVQVDADGTITGLTEGQAVITASYGSVSDSITVSVKPKLEKVEITSDHLSIITGNSLMLGLTVTPENSAIMSQEWTSSNPAVAVVFNGTVSTYAPGEVDITVTADGLSDTFTLVVEDIEAISLDQESLSLNVGEYFDLPNVTIYPNSYFDQFNIRWKVSVDNVIDLGSREAVGEGTVELRAVYGDVESEPCVITVSDPMVDAGTSGLSLPAWLQGTYKAVSQATVIPPEDMSVMPELHFDEYMTASASSFSRMLDLGDYLYGYGNLSVSTITRQEYNHTSWLLEYTDADGQPCTVKVTKTSSGVSVEQSSGESVWANEYTRVEMPEKELLDEETISVVLCTMSIGPDLISEYMWTGKVPDGTYITAEDKENYRILFNNYVYTDPASNEQFTVSGGSITAESSALSMSSVIENLEVNGRVVNYSFALDLSTITGLTEELVRQSLEYDVDGKKFIFPMWF